MNEQNVNMQEEPGAFPDYSPLVIEVFMKRRGITQKRLSQIIKRAQPTVNQILSGHMRMREHEKQKVAEALGLPDYKVLFTPFDINRDYIGNAGAAGGGNNYATATSGDNQATRQVNPA